MIPLMMFYLVLQTMFCRAGDGETLHLHFPKTVIQLQWVLKSRFPGLKFFILFVLPDHCPEIIFFSLNPQKHIFKIIVISIIVSSTVQDLPSPYKNGFLCKVVMHTLYFFLKQHTKMVKVI